MAEDPNPGSSRSHLELHLLIDELRDERDRSRLREAAWLSIIFHLVFLIALALAPKYLPTQTVQVASVRDILRDAPDRDLTFLALPPDAQKPPAQRPDTNIISDKDRIAQSRTPVPDRKQLNELLDPHRAGAPGTPAPPPVQAQSSAPPQPQSQQGQQSESREQGSSRPEPANQLARLETPPMDRRPAGGFSPGVSASSALEQAARASASRRGIGGEFGMGSSPNSNVGGGLDILSDTMGVDFGPYLARVQQVVRENWIILVPEVARAPLMKRGRVSIEFAILKNGSVAGMRLVSTSGDVSLDRAAWGGITASNPFQPLPNDFKGQYLQLRFRFYYNPEKGELQSR